MGMGRYSSGRFDLVLSVRHQADATRLLEWERSFRRASELLYDATDGQMQFGRVYVANGARGSAEADGHLMELDGGSFTTTPIPGLGTSGLHVVLMGDERYKPFIVLHEFAHYAFGVWDEYEDATQCTNDTATGACVMEWGWPDGDQLAADGTLTPGAITEFCTATNHDPDRGTEQEAMNGESCWETIVGAFPDVTAPTGLPTGPAPTGHVPIEWILLADTARFSLLLDRSGSMATGNAIAGVRFGADYWVRYLAQTGDELSVVRYNQSASDLLSPTLLDAATDLTPALTAISALSATGQTNIGGALARGLANIQNAGDQAATQVIVLFSDGRHNTGTSPGAVLPQLIEAGVRVYTIGFGPGADQAELLAIAAATGGRFEQIDAAPDSPAAQLEIQNHLIEVSGEVRDGSGIVTMAPGLLGEPGAGEAGEAKAYARASTHAATASVAKRPFRYRPTPLGGDHKAYIEAGSRRATFVVSHAIGTEVSFHLVRPDGSPVDPATDNDARLVAPKGVPYAFYVVEQPTAGTWVMRVGRAQPRGAIPYKVFAFSDNPDLHLSFAGLGGPLQVGGALDLAIQPIAIGSLLGTSPPRVTVTGPAGRRVRPTVRGGTDTFGAVRADRGGCCDHADPCGGRARRRHATGHTARIPLDATGVYTIEVTVVNAGKAREAGSVRERPMPGDTVAKLPTPPMFQRTRRVQVHVGPLSEGADLEPRRKPAKGR